MNKIIDYTVVQCWGSQHDFKKDVQKFLYSGWQPFGGVHVVLTSDDNGSITVWTQAMVKYAVSSPEIDHVLMVNDEVAKVSYVDDWLVNQKVSYADNNETR